MGEEGLGSNGNGNGNGLWPLWAKGVRERQAYGEGYELGGGGEEESILPLVCHKACQKGGGWVVPPPASSPPQSTAGSRGEVRGRGPSMGEASMNVVAWRLKNTASF